MRPTRRSVRRLPTALLIGLIGGVLAAPASGAATASGGASALRQTEASVSLHLVSQSAWNSIDRPLHLTFRATNLSEVALEQLSVELFIAAPARSRSLYELTLTSDATPLIVGYPYPEEGTLEPGETRTFHIGPQGLEVLEARGESALYPLKVELRSQDLPVATLRSPMVYLIEDPVIPLNFQWTWVLSEPLQYRSDGTFVSGTIEGDIAKGGRLWSMARALARLGSRQVDVVVSSVLIDQLQRMAGGYEAEEPGGGIRTVPAGAAGAADATALLRVLKDIATNDLTELVATPFGDPSLPALFRAGLTSDLKPLADRGRALVTEALGREPARDVFRPYRSHLDAATLPRLEAMGAETVLVNPKFLPGEKFTSPPVIRLTSGDSSVTGILPNPEVADLVSAYADDPYLAAHVALGELAVIWLELPGTAGRGASVLFGEDPGTPIPFLGRFAGLVRRSPWLQPVTATGYVAVVPASGTTEVPPRTYRSFPFFYAQELVHTKAALGRFRQTVQGAGALQDRLQDQLQIAAASTFVSNPSLGLTFVRAVEAAIQRTYARVRIDASLPVTLTSQAGLIPLVLTNDSSQSLRVVLQLVSDRRIQFVGGVTREITLAPGRRTLTITVQALATGRIPIKVQILSWGNAPDLVAERTMVVRSTAYNRLALLVTIGAALFLLAWWGRRFLPRRRT